MRPEFENIVDEQHVALAHIRLDVAQHFDAARGARPLAVARQHHEIDLRRQLRTMHGADEIGGKDEAALQNRHDQKAMRLLHRDVARDLLGTSGDLVFGKQDGDVVAVNMDCAHGAAFEPISSSRAKRISTFWAASGGEATRVEKVVASPGRNGRRADSTVQA